MQRFLLITWAFVLTAGVSFYFGRATHPAETPVQSSDPVSVQATSTLAKESNAEPSIGLPIAGLSVKDVQDTFDAPRGPDRRHEATDILAPTGTPVVAVTDGTIRRLFLSKPGGITVYQFDAASKYCYYYAHLDRYAENLKQGAIVKRGDTLGYVGTTGNAGNTPHLHFAIFLLGPEKNWWQGTAINPFPVLLDAVQARDR